MFVRPLAAAVSALALGAGSAGAHDFGRAATGSVYVLPAGQRDELVRTLLEQKPNPGYYAIASSLLPGAGQLALGEWREPAVVWAGLLSASMLVYSLCEGHVGLHPAYLGTTAYLVANGVRIPGSARCDKVNDLYNRFLLLSYLLAAGGTAWRTFDLAVERRAEVDRRLAPLGP